MAETSKKEPDPVKTHTLLGPSGDLLADVPISEQLNRVQALLAQWLRMENVIVLLGAGASVSQGGPLMGALEQFVLKAASEIVAGHPVLGDCLPVLRARLAEGKTSPYWFEQWLSFLTNATHIASSENSPIESVQIRGHNAAGKPETCSLSNEQLTGLLSLLGQLTYLRCSLNLSPLDGETAPSGHHAFAAKLVARDPSLGRSHIFTMNYDTLLEQALDDLGIQYADGFTGTVDRRFDPATYGLDIYYPGEIGEGRVRRFDKYIHLYKPHGSIHWRRRKNGRVVQTIDHQLGIWQEFEGYDGKTKLETLQNLFKRDSDPIGILPTENKFVQTLGMPYAHLFRAFAQRLMEPQTFLIVCGYSFGDEHLNTLIREAMTNPTLVMLVVNPSPTESLVKLVRNYQLAGERAFLLHGINTTSYDFGTFNDFSQNLLPHVKWIDDFQRLRKAENELRGIAPAFRGTDGGDK